MKRKFGPLIRKGTSPDIYLHNEKLVTVNVDDNFQYFITMTVYGASKCELVEEKEILLDETDLKKMAIEISSLERQIDKLRTTKTKVIKKWSCD